MNIKYTSIIIVACLTIKLCASPVDMMIGSRGYGLGGAYVAIANDPSAAYWNPAGLSHVSELTLMESNWILQSVENLNVNYISAAIPIKNVGTVSGSWLLLHSKLEEGWDYAADAPMSTESANEHAFSLSIGRRLWDKLLIFEKTSLGFSINRHTFKTEAGDGAGIGFDVGLQTRFPYGFSFGFVARTLGTDMMGYKIDPELRFGIGYDVLIKKMHSIVVAADGAYKMNRDYEKESTLEPAKNNLKAFGGIEYSLIFKGLRISLSGGGNGMLYSSLGTYGFAGGLGIKYLGYCVQYAFQGDTDPDVSLGYEHRITLLLELKNLFPKKVKAEEVSKKKE